MSPARATNVTPLPIRRPHDTRRGTDQHAARISIVVPVLNEAATIESCLRRLALFRARGAEVIAVDGDSADDTVERARPLCDTVIRAPRGRASQMNAGARLATGNILLFLHADTELPDAADALIRDALAREPLRAWGRFDVRISGTAPLLAVVARMMSVRSRLTGIATGDQAIFCTHDAFFAEGGFPEIALMEDVAFCKRLRRRCAPLCLRAKVVTSGRRWEAHGVMRTIALMWSLRLAYALGVPANTLSRWYRHGSCASSSRRGRQHPDA